MDFRKIPLGVCSLLPTSEPLILSAFSEEGKIEKLLLEPNKVRALKPCYISLRIPFGSSIYSAICRSSAFSLNSIRRTCGCDDGGSTFVRSPWVNAPFLAESPFIVECRVKTVAVLEHEYLIVGEIAETKASELFVEIFAAQLQPIAINEPRRESWRFI